MYHDRIAFRHAELIESASHPHCLQGLTKADVLVDPWTTGYYDSRYARYDGSHWKLSDETPGYSTDQLGDYASKFIEEQASANKPFLAIVAPVAPHRPNFPKHE